MLFGFVGAISVGLFPLAGYFMGRMVIKAGNIRNLFFMPVLKLLCATNALTHLSLITGGTDN